jgi:D-serine deaminase-like pyridoxal phosphate-dependent protein
MQHQIGSCGKNDIAVAIACPVIGKYKERGEIVIYGGAVHLSKDSVFSIKENKTIFGAVAKGQYPKGWTGIEEGVFLKGISQEHGVLTVSNKAFFNKTKIGDLIYILPIHSCLAADKHLEKELYINQN